MIDYINTNFCGIVVFFSVCSLSRVVFQHDRCYYHREENSRIQPTQYKLMHLGVKVPQINGVGGRGFGGFIHEGLDFFSLDF